MNENQAAKLITGERFVAGQPQLVQGFLDHKPNLTGKGVDDLTLVVLLTPEGDRIANVMVRVIDVLGVRPRNFSLFTDHMLWRVAETDMSDLGELALATLARREKLARQEDERERSEVLAKSRRDANALMGRV